MESFGSYIRQCRNAKGLLLREVAAQLEIDSSHLSRIECDRKRATRDQVNKLARVLALEERDLVVRYLADNIIYELAGEQHALEAVLVAEKKMRYISRRGNKSNGQRI